MSCARGCCATQREHYLSVGISAAAMPSRKGPVIARMKEDKAFSKDGPAYKRLRKEGLQPKQIDGCAKVEQLAESRVEVEAMKPLNKRKRDAFEQVTGKTVHEVKIHEGIA